MKAVTRLDWTSRIFRPWVIKKRLLHNTSLSAYIPTCSEGGEAVEDLIKAIAQRLVLSLEDLERGTDFDTLVNISEPEIRQEALLLQEEITKLKSCLQSI